MAMPNTIKQNPMINISVVLTSLFSCLAIYLFVSAPPTLPEHTTQLPHTRAKDVSNMFNAMNAINDAARHIYTSRIVGEGKAAGLAFGEDWAEPGIDKGPLPALFTRLVAGRMETKPSPLGLYLGSDQPINKSNLFTGDQANGFAQLKQSQQPVFLNTDAAGFVAMYPDIASAKPCVTCHNDHPDSPKLDWKLNDIMGATTWTYPNETLSSAEYLEIIDGFYSAISEAYQTYLLKTEEFDEHIEITDAWPEKGRKVLPNADTFMATVKAESAVKVIENLILTPNK